MVYESQISFTLDTICPWSVHFAREYRYEDANTYFRTYLAKKRWLLLPTANKSGADDLCLHQIGHRYVWPFLDSVKLEYSYVPLYAVSRSEQERMVISSDTANPALEKFRSSPSAEDVKFTIKYFPYQLYPEASNQGEDKYEWYVVQSCLLD